MESCSITQGSGLVHALLRLPTLEDILGHPVAGGSWEGFVIESLLAVAPAGTEASFYRSSAGAEIDLLLALPGRELWAIEIKRNAAPKLERGFHNACADLSPTNCFVVYGGSERYQMNRTTTATSLHALAADLLAMG